MSTNKQRTFEIYLKRYTTTCPRKNALQNHHPASWRLREIRFKTSWVLSLWGISLQDDDSERAFFGTPCHPVYNGIKHTNNQCRSKYQINNQHQEGPHQHQPISLLHNTWTKSRKSTATGTKLQLTKTKLQYLYRQQLQQQTKITKKFGTYNNTAGEISSDLYRLSCLDIWFSTFFWR